MLSWWVIIGLLVFIVTWPFVDVGFRNFWKRRARRLEANVQRAGSRDV